MRFASGLRLVQAWMLLEVSPPSPLIQAMHEPPSREVLVLCLSLMDWVGMWHALCPSGFIGHTGVLPTQAAESVVHGGAV